MTRGENLSDEVYHRTGTNRPKWITQLIATVGACVQCGSTENLEPDHIVPKSLGGRTSRDNIQVLCRRCNLKKGKQHPDNLTPSYIEEPGPGLRRYYAQIPNLIVDDPDVCPLGLALYVYYKRVAGAEGGVCFREQERVSKETGISKSQIAKCRKRLVELGYLEVEVRHLQSTRVRIRDVWAANMRQFLAEVEPIDELAEGAPAAVDETTESIHLVDAATENTPSAFDFEPDQQAAGNAASTTWMQDDADRPASGDENITGSASTTETPASTPWTQLRPPGGREEETRSKNKPLRTPHTPRVRARAGQLETAEDDDGWAVKLEDLAAEYADRLGIEPARRAIQECRETGKYRHADDKTACLREWLEEAVARVRRVLERDEARDRERFRGRGSAPRPAGHGIELDADGLIIKPFDTSRFA